MELLWIFDIYGFLVAGLLITMGTLGDRIGRRKLLLGGRRASPFRRSWLHFSTSAEMLIASRALMGVFGATIAPSTLSLIFTMFLDAKQRSTAIGLWIAAYSAGSAIGPVVGGVLLEFFWWGSVFLIGVPVMGLLLILGPRTLPEYRDPNARRLDLRSAAMSLLAILGGGLRPQADRPGRYLAPAGPGDPCRNRPRRRLRPSPAAPRIADHRCSPVPHTRVQCIPGDVPPGIFVVVGYFLFIGQYLQLVLGLSPLTAALLSLPSAIGFMVGSMTAPRFIHRFRPSVIMGSGVAIAALGAVAAPGRVG